MLWICLACTTAYSVGAEGCPHCGSADYAEEGTEMAKISRRGGPTYADVPAGPEPVVESVTSAHAVEPVLVAEDLSADAEDLDDAPNGPYAGMIRKDLQDLCADRGLPTSGNKAELIARLVADNEARAERDSEADGELGTVPVDPA